MLDYKPGGSPSRRSSSPGPIINLPKRKFVRHLWYFIGLLISVHMLNFVFNGVIVTALGISPGNVSSLWNIGTSWVVHGGVIHLLLNSFFILYIGLYMEHFARAFWIVTIVSALTSGAVVWAFGTTGTMHIGASGIGFAYLGFLAVITHWLHGPTAEQIKKSTRILLLVNILITFVIPGISITGHIGGLVAGIVLGFYYSQFYAGRRI